MQAAAVARLVVLAVCWAVWLVAVLRSKQAQGPAAFRICSAVCWAAVLRAVTLAQAALAVCLRALAAARLAAVAALAACWVAWPVRLVPVACWAVWAVRCKKRLHKTTKALARS